MNVVMIIAHEGFRDEEYFIPKEILEQEGISVTTASQETTPATGKLGRKAPIDITIESICADDYDALILIGGPGAHALITDTTTHTIAKTFYDQNKLIGAICIAPAILAEAGILKKGTVHPSGAKYLEKNAVEYTKEAVTIDGKIITADGPESADSFGNALVTALKAH